jgi:hypothetical protein
MPSCPIGEENRRGRKRASNWAANEKYNHLLISHFPFHKVGHLNRQIPTPVELSNALETKTLLERWKVEVLMKKHWAK